MKFRVINIAALAAASLLAISGCSVPSDGSSTADPSAPRPVKSIFYANILPSYPPLAESNRCFLDEAEKLGIKADTAGPTGLTADNQFNIDRISQAIANGYDAIMSAPIDKAQFTPVLQQAKDAGIWLATINTGDTTDIQNFTVGTDYGTQGATIAKELSKRSGDQYVGIIGNAPTGTNNLFVDGFKAGIEDQGITNVHYVTNEFDAADPNKTVDVVNQMLTAHPDINVVLSWEGNAAPGIITAITEKGAIGTIVGVTNDVTPQVVDAINAGIVYGTSKQDFCQMTRLAVQNLVALGNGETVPEAIDSGIIFVTKENLATEGTDD